MPYKNPYYDPSKEHHTPTGFRNLQSGGVGLSKAFRWMYQRRKNKLPLAPEEGYHTFKQLWVKPLDYQELQDTSDNRLWWLGHSSVLLKLNGQYIATDPVFSLRASPLPHLGLGPMRKTDNIFDIDLAPPLDVVLISHNHYDHLDRMTIVHILKRNKACRFLVPLGLKVWFKKLGARYVEEFDWWQSYAHHGMEFTFVPAHHWSRRSIRDINRTLWGGWVIHHAEQHYYFAGDTGYSTYLQDIGKAFPLSLAMLPIGAYSPRWMMKNHHIDPATAVQLFHELKCQRAVAIHWGVFELADESLDEPYKLLRERCQQQDIDEASFAILPIGGNLVL